jgi:hypothetical protein
MQQGERILLEPFDRDMKCVGYFTYKIWSDNIASDIED